MRDWGELLGTIAWPDKLGAPVPTFWPQNDNTHLYFAYMLRLYRPTLNSEQYAFVQSQLIGSALKLRRWNKPNTVMSHDEFLGFAIYCYMLGFQSDCSIVLAKLRETGGLTDDPDGDKPWPNVFRIVYLEGIMSACAGEKITPIQQTLFFFSCIARCFSKRGHASPFLRVWITVPVTSLFPISAAGLLIFNLGMKIRGYTLKEAFSQYFSKVPQLAILGDEYGWLD